MTNCYYYYRCTSCTNSKFPCTWCAEAHMCTQDREQCHNDLLITGLKVCFFIISLKVYLFITSLKLCIFNTGYVLYYCFKSISYITGLKVYL